jgi:hypothetical protein
MEALSYREAGSRGQRAVDLMEERMSQTRDTARDRLPATVVGTPRSETKSAP